MCTTPSLPQGQTSNVSSNNLMGHVKSIWIFAILSQVTYNLLKLIGHFLFCCTTLVLLVLQVSSFVRHLPCMEINGSRIEMEPHFIYTTYFV